MTFYEIMLIKSRTTQTSSLLLTPTVCRKERKKVERREKEEDPNREGKTEVEKRQLEKCLRERQAKGKDEIKHFAFLFHKFMVIVL